MLWLWAFTLFVSAVEWATLNGDPPIIIGHRGDAFYIPEHSVGSYSLAAWEGADYIEPDLQQSRDGEAMCGHNPYLSHTTDAETVFPALNLSFRWRQQAFDGINRSDYWMEDFYLAELHQLRLRQGQHNPQLRNQHFNGLYPVVSFEEFLILAIALANETGRTLPVIPEIKHPQHYSEINSALGRNSRALEHRTLALLLAYGFGHQQGPAVIQSFDSACLEHLDGLLRLVSPDSEYLFGLLSTLAGLPHPLSATDEFAALVEYIDTRDSPKSKSNPNSNSNSNSDTTTPSTITSTLWSKNDVESGSGGGRLKSGVRAREAPYGVYDFNISLLFATNDYSDDALDEACLFSQIITFEKTIVLDYPEVVQSAHMRGMSVAVYTLRNAKEDPTVDERFGGDLHAEYFFLFKAGVDFLFSEKVDEGLSARQRYQDVGPLPTTAPPKPDVSKWRAAVIALSVFLALSCFCCCFLFRRWRHGRFDLLKEVDLDRT